MTSSSEPPSATRAGGREPDITARDASAEQSTDGFVLLDVREPDEWQAGHAPGAQHVPIGQLPAHSLDPATPVVVVCHVGGRSSRAANYLAAAGFSVRNLAGGMAAWEREGLPVVRDDGTPGHID